MLCLFGYLPGLISIDSGCPVVCIVVIDVSVHFFFKYIFSFIFKDVFVGVVPQSEWLGGLAALFKIGLICRSSFPSFFSSLL